MNKILIIGSCGAGKSTLARRLGERLGLPVIHLDRHYWHPGWQPTPEAAWRETVRALVQGERWIIDGNYGGTFDIRFPAADAIILYHYILRFRMTSRPRIEQAYRQYGGGKTLLRFRKPSALERWLAALMADGR